jgi:hypothetical protein
MNSGYFLINPFSEEEDVKKFLETVREDISNDRWEEANENMDKLKKAWNIIEQRIQFSIEKDILDDFERTIFELDSKIIVRNKEQALSKAIISQYIWDELK